MATSLGLKKPMIAITGSAGKSTTKEMLAAILRRKWKVFKTPANHNLYSHTRNYAKQLKRGSYRAAVLEYGLSAKGHIRLHCQAIRPDISIVTNIGTAHLGSFGGDIKKLIRAKSEIIRYMSPSGMAVYNIDDANSRAMPKGNFRGTLVTVGIQSAKADYRAQNISYGKGGMNFSVKIDGTSQRFFIPIYGRHQVYNGLCAIAVASRLGFTPAEIRAGLRNYTRMQSRLTVRRVPSGALVIDDTYSANPNAAKAAIDVLSAIGGKNKVAVLGNMLSLGQYTKIGHRGVGSYIAKKRVTYLYTYGKYAYQIGSSAVAAGFNSNHWRHFTSRPALHQSLRKHLQQGTTFLVKGSHATNMKQTVLYLVRSKK
ncbi:UDP-N-acetylmuramoyl-tripeptide--D-alanyl-D-alanine ligase [Alicyclobacillus sp. SO9]|uniref:UDP-N-acetylmuramoyl-tripeptide--D-alanyl-D- alanine ligase n=1 Tax=Alicyclobacillus sp. SO9 TaxID=2665646 RepID=UPI0018E7A723|nr:UDP-N-acetylmuramoyl-tripeptide--D-alanyl-D-alanine ligase [Alicyclobacillus sp. SO9]QQE78885.1 UDP-N-acetylmuramoyl-tripeptide--D-alanyl-D-alanine ligase [Alicyclobacillus sp. SO9]